VSSRVVLGRAAELAAIARFVQDAPPPPRSLVIEGEAGIGKTTLWEDCLRRVDDGPLLVSWASEAERDLSFTVLGDLLGPVLDRALDRLPPTQRRALEAALLLTDAHEAPPDARAVSLATLACIRGLAAGGPVTVAIDDVQWADVPSARALAFALRRLRGEPVRLVLARRTGEASVDPIGAALPRAATRIEVGPIEAAALGPLIRRRTGERVAPPLAARIHRAAGGNPFYALEIAEALGRGRIAVAPGRPLRIPRNLHELVRDRVRTVAEGARDALLLLSASTEPTEAGLARVGAALDDLASAEREGLVERRGDELAFTHPLLAAAVYEEATPEARRDAHRRLSEAATDPEGRARHLALASTAPDASVTAALEEAARHARSRGAPAAAADLLELARTFLDPSERHEAARLAWLTAGNLHDAGDVGRAREVLAAAIDDAPPGLERTTCLFTASILEWNDVVRVRDLAERAIAETDDARLHTRARSDLVWAWLLAGDVGAALASGEAAVAAAEPDDVVGRRGAHACLGLARAIAGLDAREDLEAAVALEGRFSTFEGHSGRLFRGLVRTWAGDLDGARSDLASVDDALRAQGLESQRHLLLAWLGALEIRSGDLGAAIAAADAAEEICEDVGLHAARDDARTVRAAARALLGDAEAAVREAEAIERSARAHGDGWAVVEAAWVRGFVALSIGDHASAHAWFDPALAWVERSGIREPGLFPYVPDDVEALVALGDLEAARALTDRLEERGRALDRPLALATATRCRALIAAALGDLPGALAHAEASLEYHARAPQPFDLARTRLVHGEILRRMKQKAGARSALVEALHVFEGIGARLWVERARRELSRIGGRPPTPDTLTETEAQVAELVAGGATNREAAAALFMSVHTVESNLKRIYRKLGVRSRTELSVRLHGS
jgi:DNA-binding CsgD family transcriptional regulator